eukprot:COSAG05_NODE_1342_length_5140_cov_2.897838_9_plen_97_part_00
MKTQSSFEYYSNICVFAVILESDDKSYTGVVSTVGFEGGFGYRSFSFFLRCSCRSFVFCANSMRFAWIASFVLSFACVDITWIFQESLRIVQCAQC